MTCNAGYHSCDASLGGGCCLSGYACAPNSCYVTSISTFVVTETLTTTGVEAIPTTVTTTFTTASTPFIPSSVATSTLPSGVIAKVTPTGTPSAIAKTAATDPNSSSGGLTKTQIGGIIGGAVAILIVIAVAAFFILRRLNKAIKIETASRGRTKTSSGPRDSSGFTSRRSKQVDMPDIDAISNDPFLMTPSEVSRSVKRPSALQRSTHEVEAASPPITGALFSPDTPDFNHYPRGYNAVPTSESISSSGRRQLSIDSIPTAFQKPPGESYFDIPLAQPDLRDQNLRYGHSPPVMRPVHERNMSNFSDTSQASQELNNLVELDADPAGSRRSSLQGFFQGLGTNQRRSSQASPSLPSSPMKQDVNAVPGAFVLSHIPEAGESLIAGSDREREGIERMLNSMGNEKKPEHGVG
jgi:hypothetical protein